MSDQAPAQTGFTRDRETRVVYLHLAVFGYFLYSFGPAVALLREEQRISAAVSALHVSAFAVGAVIAGIFCSRAAARIRRGTLMRAGLIGMVGGIALFTATAALPVTLLGAAIAGTFASVLVNTHSPVLSDHHPGAGAAAISEANALTAAIGLLGPLALGAGVAVGVGWRAGILVTVVLAAASLAYSRGVRLPDHPRPLSSASPPPPAGTPPGRYWMAWVVFVLCVAVEFSMALWGSDLLRRQSGAGDATAAGAIMFMVAGMAVGRVAGGRLTLRHPADRLLCAALAVNAAGFALFWLSHVTWLSIAGLFVVGLGIAMQFPLNMSRAIAASNGRPDIAAARAGLGGGLAMAAAPFALGLLADTVGLSAAFLLVPVLLLMAAAVTVADGALSARTP
jgi:predicted MFS family arabinose efflux permease